jgi:hypothetical protein
VKEKDRAEQKATFLKGKTESREEWEEQAKQWRFPTDQ